MSIKTKKRQLFNSYAIATAISKKLDRDFNEANMLYASDETTRYVKDRQRRDLLKKFVPPRLSQDDLQEECFSKFLSINKHLGDFQEFSIPDRDFIQSSDTLSEKILLRVKAIVRMVLGSDFDLEELYSLSKNSGGSSIGVSFNDTSLEAKLTFPITATRELKNLLRDYCSWDRLFYEEVLKFNTSNPLQDPISYVEGSRATTVDKTIESRRMICIEPTGNMYFQQGLMLMMYKRLARVGLNVETLPEHHQVRAQLSSITSNEATIDWSSASDCVSIGLLRLVLPPKWFAMVDMLRCKQISINGENVHLNMISTMGNAGTFPLETLVFWAFAMATSMPESNMLLPEWKDFKTCSVFGDDCIVPTSSAPLFIKELTKVGFIINDSKSFYDDEGFRESCGGDFLHGIPVRPYCLKGPHNERLSSLEPWLYIVTNSLLEKYFSYFGELAYIYDKAVLDYLFSLFVKYKINIKIVPNDFPDDSGLRISNDLLRLKSIYPEVKFSRISRSEHGTYTFQFCRFQYWESVDKHDGIRYAHKLKKLKHLNLLSYKRKERKVYNTRRKGGYVVAKGLSSHWTIPMIGQDSFL